MKQRTEEEYYVESRRLREETMRMADALKDNPMRFGVRKFEEIKTAELIC